MHNKEYNNKAVVLLSGGLDSATTLAVAKEMAFDNFALTISYGQKNHFEIQAAAEIAKQFHVIEHKVLEINLSIFGGSSLTTTQAVEKNRTREEIGKSIPSTYVPARNTIFLSLALAWADVLQASNIFIGVSSVDSSGYPDCRQEFIDAFSHTANLATKLGTEGKQNIKIHTPLINLTKAETIKLGLSLGVDYRNTRTCYDPNTDGTPCKICDSCILRQQGFRELGLDDPLILPN
jgi:7-cyano-7-deazaguanine synthase